MALFPFQHAWQDGMCQMHHGPKIQVDHLVVLLRCMFKKWLVPADAGVIDQHVDGPHGGLDIVDTLFCYTRFGEIQCKYACVTSILSFKRGRQFIQVFLVTCNQCQSVTAFGTGNCKLPANSTTGTGYQYQFLFRFKCLVQWSTPKCNYCSTQY